MNIYVASSWRNKYQPEIIYALRNAGHVVYDFRHPAPGDEGFAWSQIDPEWEAWKPSVFRARLRHPLALYGYARDVGGLDGCDVCVLALPCGRSAHLEAGYAKGMGKILIAYIPEECEPELMYLMADAIATTPEELLRAVYRWKRRLRAHA